MDAGQLAREPRFHGFAVLGLVAQDDLVRDGRGRVVVAQQEHVQQVVVGHVLAAVQHELVRVDDAALAHHEHVHARHRLLAEQAHHVGVQVARGHGVLLVGQAVDGVDARLDACRALEVGARRPPPASRRSTRPRTRGAGRTGTARCAARSRRTPLARCGRSTRRGPSPRARRSTGAPPRSSGTRFCRRVPTCASCAAIRRTTWRTKGPRGARCPPCRGRRGCRCRVRSTWCRVGASRACT